MTRIPDQIYRRLPKRFPDEMKFSNYCLSFDIALTQYVNVPDAPSLRLTNTGAILFWFKSEVPSAWQTYVGKHTALTTATVSYVVYRPNVHRTSLYISDGINDQTLQSPSFAANYRIWHFCAARWDGGFLRNSVDLLEAVPVAQTINAQANPAHPLRIGEVTGLEDEIMVLPTITDQQIREIYYQGCARRGLDARLVMRLEEGSGLTAYDESDYGNNGSLLPALTPPTWTKMKKHELLAEAGV